MTHSPAFGGEIARKLAAVIFYVKMREYSREPPLPCGCRRR